MSRTPTRERRLTDLVSVGPATLRDLKRLGIRSLPQLARAKPAGLYRRLSKITGRRQDPCVLDTFTCAVKQAQNPRLPEKQKKWWYWSRVRKARSNRTLL